LNVNATSHEWHALIQASLDGQATAEQSERLNVLLRENPAARDLYLELADTHSCLAVDEQLWIVERESPSTAVYVRSSWLAWRSLAAAAAGLVIGLLSASVVWSYVVPLAAKGVRLLQESFETGPAPLTTGMPIQAGRWSGDFTEVVGAHQQVTPETGSKMLRLLRADYDGKENPGGYVADLHQFIDLRPYQSEFADGGAVVQFSAGFNAFEFPAVESYRCIMSLHALDAEMLKNGAANDRQLLNAEALAMTSSNRLLLDRQPATWQRQTAELRLPPNAAFLLIHIGVTHVTKPQRRVEFDGHYLDEVRLVLTRRAPLP
jgi:hypothetical protein